MVLMKKEELAIGYVPRLPFDEFGYICYVLPSISEEQTQQEAWRIEEALEINPGDKILDIGCGNGRHTNALSNKYSLLGIDPSQRLLAMAQLFSATNRSHAQFIQGDSIRLSFQSASLDGAFSVFSSFGFYGRKGDSQTIQEVSRVLKNGKRFYLETFTYNNSPCQNTVAWKNDNKITFSDTWSLDQNNMLIVTRTAKDGQGVFAKTQLLLFTYSPKDLTDMFQQAQLSIVKTEILPPSERIPLQRLAMIGQKN